MTDPWVRLAEVVAPQVLLKAGIDEATIADFLNCHVPGLVTRFPELISE